MKYFFIRFLMALLALTGGMLSASEAEKDANYGWHSHKRHCFKPGVVPVNLAAEISLSLHHFLDTNYHKGYDHLRPAPAFVAYLGNQLEQFLKLSNPTPEQILVAGRTSQSIFALLMQGLGCDGLATPQEDNSHIATDEETLGYRHALTFAALVSPNPAMAKESLFCKSFDLGRTVDAPQYQDPLYQGHFAFIKTHLDGVGLLYQGLKAKQPVDQISKNALDPKQWTKRYYHHEMGDACPLKHLPEYEVEHFDIFPYLQNFDFDRYSKLVNPYVNKTYDWNKAYSFGVSKGLIYQFAPKDKLGLYVKVGEEKEVFYPSSASKVKGDLSCLSIYPNWECGTSGKEEGISIGAYFGEAIDENYHNYVDLLATQLRNKKIQPVTLRLITKDGESNINFHFEKDCLTFGSSKLFNWLSVFSTNNIAFGKETDPLIEFTSEAVTDKDPEWVDYAAENAVRLCDVLTVKGKKIDVVKAIIATYYGSTYLQGSEQIYAGHHTTAPAHQRWDNGESYNYQAYVPNGTTFYSGVDLTFKSSNLTSYCTEMIALREIDGDGSEYKGSTMELWGVNATAYNRFNLTAENIKFAGKTADYSPISFITLPYWLTRQSTVKCYGNSFFNYSNVYLSYENGLEFLNKTLTGVNPHPAEVKEKKFYSILPTITWQEDVPMNSNRTDAVPSKNIGLMINMNFGGGSSKPSSNSTGGWCGNSMTSIGRGSSGSSGGGMRIGFGGGGGYDGPMTGTRSVIRKIEHLPFPTSDSVLGNHSWSINAITNKFTIGYNSQTGPSFSLNTTNPALNRIIQGLNLVKGGYEMYEDFKNTNNRPVVMSCYPLIIGGGAKIAYDLTRAYSVITTLGRFIGSFDKTHEEYINQLKKKAQEQESKKVGERPEKESEWKYPETPNDDEGKSKKDKVFINHEDGWREHKKNGTFWKKCKGNHGDEQYIVYDSKVARDTNKSGAKVWLSGNVRKANDQSLKGTIRNPEFKK